MTGHAIQCLLMDAEIRTLFHDVAKRLSRDGSFCFETRNARIKPGLRWTPEQTRPAASLPKGRTVRVVQRVLGVDGEHVAFEEVYHISGLANPLTSQSTLRFPTLQRIEQLAQASGLQVGAVYGDWAGGAFEDNSPEIIIRLDRTE